MDALIALARVKLGVCFDLRKLARENCLTFNLLVCRLAKPIF
jgi:hypothetical protein